MAVRVMGFWRRFLLLLGLLRSSNALFPERRLESLQLRGRHGWLRSIQRKAQSEVDERRDEIVTFSEQTGGRVQIARGEGAGRRMRRSGLQGLIATGPQP